MVNDGATHDEVATKYRIPRTTVTSIVARASLIYKEVEAQKEFKLAPSKAKRRTVTTDNVTA